MATDLEESTSSQLNFSFTPPSIPPPPPPPENEQQLSPKGPDFLGEDKNKQAPKPSLSPSVEVHKKPPLAQKPKKLVKALTQSSMFRSHKPSVDTSPNRQDKKEKRKSMSNLREQPLWKLPGLGSTRHSTTRAPDQISKEAKQLQPLPELPQTPPSLSTRRCSLPNIVTDAPTPPLSDSPPPPLPPPRPPSPVYDTENQSTTPTRPHTPPVPLKESTKDDNISVSSERIQEEVTTEDKEVQGGSQEKPPGPQSFSIGELILRFSKRFPLQIKVLQGYCSETNDVTMSTDDEYNIHFVKNTRTVKAKDEDGFMHSLPLGGGMRFGLIYNPNNDYDEALQGLEFERVADIIAMPTLPKVICARKSWVSQDEKVSVEENELFSVRQIHKPMFGKKGLKVCSVLTHEDRILPDDCSGSFSTKPSLARLHLPQILEYISSPFPCQVVMYSSTDTTQSGHHMRDTQSRVITMTECLTETALVASVSCGQEVPDEEDQMFDIPLDDELAEIEVALLKCKEEEEEGDKDKHVSDDTVNFGSLRDPEMEQRYQEEEEDLDEEDHTYDDTISVLQQYEGKLRGDDATATKSPTSQPTAQDDARNKDLDMEDGYATLPVSLQKEQPPKPPSDTDSSGYARVDREKKSEGKDGTSPMLAGWMQDIQSTAQSLERRLKSLESSQQLSELGSMQTMLEGLTKKLESVDAQLHSLQPPNKETTVSSAVEKGDHSITKENQEHLATLNEEEILQMLDLMDLGQYKEFFEREHITGEVLVECDEEVLKFELGMASKIHRIRVMKIITGQKSVKSVLESSNSVSN